ncbi:MAG: aspartate/glutamate racemase family protein [Spirochaetia bacterium]
MKLRIVVPIITDLFNQEVVKEVAQFKAPDTEIDVVNIVRGPASIESRYDEMLASPDIVEKVVQAEKDGFDGVFVDCFGDPGVHAAREMVRIPVVGAFQPAALTASLIAGRWSVVTVLKSVVPLVDDLGRKLGLSQNIVSIRDIDTPVLELQDKGVLEKKLLAQIELAVQEGAEAIVLGCTGMLGLAQTLEKTMGEKGRAVPVVDPTAAAIGFLELLVRSKLSHSLLAYPYPPEKERKF